MIHFFIIILITISVFITGWFKILTVPASILTSIMACVLYFAGGFAWLVPPLLFLSTSTIFSRVFALSKSRDRTRNFYQVFANGGIALILGIVYYFYSHSFIPSLIVLVFSSANADTWATEFGGRFGGKPVSLRTFEKTDAGISGSISLIGTIASLAGSFFIMLIAVLINIVNPDHLLILTIIGFSAALFDSFLGAWLQGIWIDNKGRFYEDNYPEKHNNLKQIQGIKFINNDCVNFLSSLMSVLVALALINYFPIH